MKTRFLLFTIFLTMLLFVVPALAQDGGEVATGDPSVSPWALVVGAGITAVVGLLKRISFVRNHPKVIATVLSLAVTGITALAGARAGSGIWPFVLTAVTQLASAIGTHEVVVRSLTPAR